MDDMTIESCLYPDRPGTRGLRLSGCMTIGQAAGIREALLEALGEAGDLRVDLSGVTEIDLTGLQILGAAQQSARTLGKGFRIDPGVNQAYLDTVAGAGLWRDNGDPDSKGTCIWVGGES